MSNSLIKNMGHHHDNKPVIDAFTDTGGVVYYKGKLIQGAGGEDSTVTISPQANNALTKILDGYFVEGFTISTNTNNILTKKANGYYVPDVAISSYSGNMLTKKTDGLYSDALISKTTNNAISKVSDGLYVEKMIASSSANNALSKYPDGWFVPALPTDLATMNEINNTKQDLQNSFDTSVTELNQRYDTISNQLNTVLLDTRKHNTHAFENVVALDFINVVTLSSLYTSSNVILNSEFMVKNNSDNPLYITIKENNIITMQEVLSSKEVQRYKLPNITQIKINAKGSCNLYLYIDYI